MSIPGAITVAIALTCIAWSLWVRRITWASRWESAATLSIAFQGASLVLITPAGAPVGRLLHWAIGEPHLQRPVAHTCLILAAAAIVYSVLDRIYDDDTELCATFKQWVERPVTLAIMGLLATFCVGGVGVGIAGGKYHPGWANMYWALFCGTIAYLLLYACRALLVLRRDCRQRRVADLYLVACSSGVLASASRMADVLFTPDSAVGKTLVWVLACVWLSGFALASAYAWRQKRRPFQALEEAVAG